LFYEKIGKNQSINSNEEETMEKLRGFEIAKGFENSQINLPVRKTKYSAGYDIEAAEDVIIPSFKKGMNPTLVKTGLKAYMQDDEVMLLYNRSSNPKKKGLIMANSVGVIDKDYYGNLDNDGHFMFAFYNIKEEDITIKKGEAIGQAIFQKYLVTDDDNAQGERMGGFGSTTQ
jgi:dUTP pyrophosphatase